MARLKSRVVTASESPEALSAAPAVKPNESTENSSGSIDSAASNTCPHCNLTFPDMGPQDFGGHVASCTADEGVSESSLSPPPTEPNSPSVVARYFRSLHASAAGQNKLRVVNGFATSGTPTTNGTEDGQVSATDEGLIRPYINPKAAFDYYDKIDERETSVVTAKNSQEPEDTKSSVNGNRASSAEEKSEVRNRFPFPKFTPIEVIEEYLANPEDMPYEKLYFRAENAASIMCDYQKEWDLIGKEIYAHESYVKAQAKELAEQAKEFEEEKAKVEDQRYLQVADDFKLQLRLSRSDWDKFLESFETSNPNETDVLERLRSLRLPNFLAGVYKRQKAREPEIIRLVDRPLTAERVTKEELNLDKRKRGRLMDPITFDDIKHADAYGFNYSSQPHHVGNQPQPTYKGDIKTRGEAEDEGRSRSRRNKAQKNYDADKSVTPETESDDLPAKRLRKPRINLDVPVEPQPRVRTAPQSRSATPAVRTFPSGKRIGRPPTKSKLKDVQVPPVSATPTIANDTAHRKLAPKEEEQLQHAAKSLVKKTHRSTAQSVEGVDTTQATSAESSRPSTSSSTESRKRKRGSNKTEPDTLVVDAPLNNPILPPGVASGARQTPIPANRKRKTKEEEIDESTLDPEALEKLRKRKIKSAKLSESLRKRWQSGDMAGAMETRKATNAAKKAAKEAAAAVATGGAVLPQAPVIAPTPPAPKAIQPQPAPPFAATATATTETSTPKRKQSNAKPIVSAKSTSSTKGNKRTPASTMPPVRQPSTRTRKPTRIAMGMDGADDDDEEYEEDPHQQFQSEYDHYQALTSPASPVVLGKRARKTKIDLAAAMSDDGDEPEEYY